MEVSPHGRAYLRPEGGGLEWDVRIEDVDLVETEEPHQWPPVACWGTWPSE